MAPHALGVRAVGSSGQERWQVEDGCSTWAAGLGCELVGREGREKGVGFATELGPRSRKPKELI